MGECISLKYSHYHCWNNFDVFSIYAILSETLKFTFNLNNLFWGRFEFKEGLDNFAVTYPCDQPTLILYWSCNWTK